MNQPTVSYPSSLVNMSNTLPRPLSSIGVTSFAGGGVSPSDGRLKFRPSDFEVTEVSLSGVSAPNAAVSSGYGPFTDPYPTIEEVDDVRFDATFHDLDPSESAELVRMNEVGRENLMHYHRFGSVPNAPKGETVSTPYGLGYVRGTGGDGTVLVEPAGWRLAGHSVPVMYLSSDCVKPHDEGEVEPLRISNVEGKDGR